MSRISTGGVRNRGADRNFANSVSQGSLVIRLVQLSSEREGFCLQLVRAQDQLQQVAAWYNGANE